MATTYKVKYKNHCTPQEQVSSGGRWYLDSDCGRKLTGSSDTSATLAGTGTLTTGTAITDSATQIASSKKAEAEAYKKSSSSPDSVEIGSKNIPEHIKQAMKSTPTKAPSYVTKSTKK